MEQAKELIEQLAANGALLQATLSNPRKKQQNTPSKVKIKPILLKGSLHYQFAYTEGAQERHENLAPGEAAERMIRLLTEEFKQGLFQSGEKDYQVLVNKKGRASILAKPATKQTTELVHNRKKQYILEEGVPVPFLVELGVMNAEGRVIGAKYDKFRQINRFLEMIADVMPSLPAIPGKPLTIIDFGCGKSYLTFALYHYLVHIENREVDITGLDLKADVIERCSLLAGKLGYKDLRFRIGDIAQYDESEEADLVVTLHACDTATDAALEKAVRWNARVILSVPCCQHELFAQVESLTLSPMLGYGIIKERFAALATDSIRARLLELLGYKTQILEFIDMEHTPKNLLIRAVQTSSRDAGLLRKKAEEYKEFKRFLSVDPYLERALSDKLQSILSE